MPWTVDNPPSPAKNWGETEKAKCVKAANAVLRGGGSEQDAIFACIHAAGRSEKKMTDTTTIPVYTTTIGTDDAVEEKTTSDQKMYGEPAHLMGGGPTSFAELDALEEANDKLGEMRDLSGKMSMLAENIFMDGTIEDKAVALRELADEFAGRLQSAKEKAVWTTKYVNDLPDSSFLYVEAGDKDGEGKTVPRSKRHFPYKDAGGKVDLPHLRNAIARIPQSNAPGLTAEKKQQLQERARRILAEQNKETGWFTELVERVKEALGLTKKEPQDNSGLMLWKEADGTYKWLARYSNNFRDEDSPPEIIAAKSHQHFVELVDKGEVDAPELWLWHVKEWKWGKANWVAYDDSGFALAGGEVVKGFEPLAEQIMALDPEQIRVSHGMPKTSIRRDADDPSIIIEHITREISPLPAWAAANSRTGFSILKEVAMAIPDEKRTALQEEWGLSPDLLGSLEAANASDAKEAEEAGIEHKDKEADNEPTPTETQPEPPVEAKPLTRDELGAVLNAIGQQFTKLNEAVIALAGEVKELKEHRAAEDEETLTDLFQRAIGHEQARVDGRSALAKKGPKETKPEDQQPAIVNTGNPLVDNMVNSLVTGSWVEGFRQEREV